MAFNPDITEVKGIVTGIPNKVYSQGMEGRDMWEEIFRRFGKENSAKNATDLRRKQIHSCYRSQEYER